MSMFEKDQGIPHRAEHREGDVLLSELYPDLAAVGGSGRQRLATRKPGHLLHQMRVAERKKAEI